MTFRDLSYWGIFKITLILNWAIPILLAPFVFLFWKAKPEAFSVETPFSLRVFGMRVKSSNEELMGLVEIIPVFLILWFFGMLIQTGILWAIGRYTLVGKIRLSA